MAEKLLEEREEVKDDERLSHSVTVKTDENLGTKFSPSEHRDGVRGELNTDKDTVRHYDQKFEHKKSLLQDGSGPHPSSHEVRAAALPLGQSAGT
jgi:hypothetical protein